MIEKADVDKAVIDFCMEVIKEPLNHFSEADLHILLIEKLYEKIPLLKKRKYDTNVNRGENSKTYYKINLLHREYGSEKECDTKRSGNIDIVIFDELYVKKINNPNLTIDSDDGYLSPLFAFELGTEKTGIRNTQKHLTSDRKKLEGCREAGYIIHIVRDTNRKKQEAKERSIDEGFKKIIDKNYKENRDNDKIKIIAVVLHLFRKQGETRCEIFDGSIRDWRPFENPRISESKIRELLKSQLE